MGAQPSALAADGRATAVASQLSSALGALDHNQAMGLLRALGQQLQLATEELRNCSAPAEGLPGMQLALHKAGAGAPESTVHGGLVGNFLGGASSGRDLFNVGQVEAAVATQSGPAT